MIPIMPITPRAVPVIQFPKSTPTKANGTENMITKGLMKDSNWEAITIYTSITMRTMSMRRSLNIDCWSSKSPLITVERLPGRSASSTMVLIASTASLRALPFEMMPVTLIYLSLFFLSMVGGILASTTVPRSFMRTGLPIPLYTTMFSMSSMLRLNSLPYLTRMLYSSPSSR